MASILLVDDSSTIRDEVSTFLHRKGLSVVTAINGEDGLAKFKADPEIKLIVVDINMPTMDGMTMVETIRNELANSTVHIVMLTTDNDAAMRERGKTVGLTGWIIKPFNGEKVLEVFRLLTSGEAASPQL
jgi:two-component system chemotaxis response regulator CheY